MKQKDDSDQGLGRRVPRQERSRVKVELMFEAATRLLEETEVEAVSTNAIARLAGVSIGTLYQYFPDKDALFQALAERELSGLSERILAVVQGPVPARPGGRIVDVVGAVLDAYGGRGLAHQRLMQYSISRGTSGMLAPMLRQLQTTFVQRGVEGAAMGDGTPMPLSAAFVLTHAVNGVLRAAVVAPADEYGGREGLEAALTRLVMGYLGTKSPSINKAHPWEGWQ